VIIAIFTPGLSGSRISNLRIIPIFGAVKQLTQPPT
jgi:hypothetical protein